jgi:cation diffusion facilitator CzcD-associated flavoprotein CzcO
MLETAIIGAGPYGLSMASHFRRAGISFRIFGRPMDSWLVHMPKGMLLKSDGFASNINDSAAEFTLGRFCAERGIEYADVGIPVRLDTFSAYGLAFRERLVPELEEKLVLEVQRLDKGFRLLLDDGETFTARRVVIAVGITHFSHTPANLARLPPEFLSHSYCHHNLETFKGRKVIVIGGGASASDLAGLLHDAGAEVQLVTRQPSLRFNQMSMSRQRSWWQQIRNPQSGLGPGLRSRFFANYPGMFHYLPQRLRLHAVRTQLGPIGGWFTKEKVVGRVPLLCGYTPERAEVKDGRIILHLRSADDKRAIVAEHIITATGYKVDMERLKFLSTGIRAKLKAVENSPVLSSTFESSIPGLYFVGIAAANSFGPVMRFAFGSAFAARRVTQAIVKSLAREQRSVPDTSTEAITE